MSATGYFADENGIDWDEFTLSANDLAAKRFLESILAFDMTDDYYNGKA